jgi:hypothetical protein
MPEPAPSPSVEMFLQGVQVRQHRHDQIKPEATDAMVLAEYAITNYQIGNYAARVAHGAPWDACMHPDDLVRHRKKAARELRRRGLTVSPLAETLLADELLRCNAEIDQTGILRKEIARRGSEFPSEAEETKEAQC